MYVNDDDYNEDKKWKKWLSEQRIESTKTNKPKKLFKKKQSKKLYNPADDAIDLSIVEHEM